MDKDPSDQNAQIMDALRVSEARLSRILDIADDAIISIDHKHYITLFNQGAEKIFGYSAQEVIGRPLDLLLPREFTDSHRRHISEFAESPETARKMGRRNEIFGLRKDGTLFPAEASISKLETEGEKIFTVILRDITERKQMETELRLAHDDLDLRVNQRTSELESANLQLQAALEEKEVLLKEIHHRVKNNLQIISSLLNLQSGYLTDERAIDVFKDCKNRVEAMALIHEQLYRSGSQSGVDLQKYIETLANDLFVSYGADNTAISLHLDMQHVFVNIDTAIPCSLIINELVSNALKHAFKGRDKGTIDISLRPVINGKFLLVVRDDGIGIPENLDVSKTDSLGLRLVNALSTQLRGGVEFVSNNGTEVRINFSSADYKERI